MLVRPSIENAWELDAGQPRADTFPHDFVCQMSPNFPLDIELNDNLFGSSLPVVSGATKKLIEVASTNRIEFLPTRIMNHKGRLEAAPYFFLHPLDVCDCVDVEASGIVWNEIDPTLICSMDQCVLNPKLIPTDFTAFRMKSMGHNIIVRGDLVDSLIAANLKGLAFLNTREYRGIG